jgi:predicted enzyme related to lactoylglutathione lyase
VIGRISFATIDANDPERLAAFWAEVLGTSIEDRADGGRFVFLARAEGQLLAFQRVSEPKRGKNRMHLDVRVDELPAATDAIVAVGGSWDGNELELDGAVWRTLRDPEGNEFDIFVTAG